MATKSLKPKGGSCCAVATCINYAGKVKRDGNTNISFYRFPKDPELQKKWTLKCRRGDSMNPGLSYMCSEHFSDDAYIRDLKAELLAYTPKFRKLKPDAMPTLNLPEDHTHRDVASISSSSRRSRIEARTKKQDHDDLITSVMSTDIVCPSDVPSSTVMIEDDSTLSTKPNYEQFNRMEMPEKYYPVVLKYVKQRVLIRMNHLNHHSTLLSKKRKAKSNLRRLQKLNRLMT